MGEQKIDAIILAGGTSLNYFTGIRWGNSERLFAVVIPKVGNPYIVTPAFEEDRTREQLVAGPMEHTDVSVYQEDESPFEKVAQGLKDRGIATGRIGVEETTKFVFADSVGGAAPALNVTSATPITAGCRMIKEAHEVELMRLACQVTLKCYEAVFRALQPGMTQNQVSGLIAAGVRPARLPGLRQRAGRRIHRASPRLDHAADDPRRHDHHDRRWLHGRRLSVGHHADLRARQGDRQDEEGLRHRPPGADGGAQGGASRAWRSSRSTPPARKVVVDAGYGPGFKYFTHRLGHGMGMDGHEWPYLVKNNMFGWEKALKAQPGMVFSDEPGIYIRGEFGVRLEDDMHITADGAELFTPQSPSIEHPFGA